MIEERTTRLWGKMSQMKETQTQGFKSFNLSWCSVGSCSYSIAFSAWSIVFGFCQAPLPRPLGAGARVIYCCCSLIFNITKWKSINLSLRKFSDSDHPFMLNKHSAHNFQELFMINGKLVVSPWSEHEQSSKTGVDSPPALFCPLW